MLPMDVKQAQTFLLEHGVKFKPEVVERKKSDACRRPYLGPKLRSHPDLAEVFPSKIQLACQLVDWAVEHGLTQPFVFDSWYTCKDLCEHITGCNRDWIGTVDGSEGIYWRGNWHGLDQWVKSRPIGEFDKVRYQYRGEWECYWAGSWVAQVGKLGRVRVVASYKREDRSDNPKFFLANNLTWERKHILQRRRRRSRGRDLLRRGQRANRVR